MGEIDFSGLRRDVEEATRLPSFSVVERRAWRRRVSDRFTVAAAIVATIAAIAPVVVAASTGTVRRPPLLRVDDPQRTETVPGPEPTTALRAVTGGSFDTLYAAFDTCRGESGDARCNLQVTQLGGGYARPASLATGLLRPDPRAVLVDVRLSMLSPRSMLLSAKGAIGQTFTVRIGTEGGTHAVETPTRLLDLRPGDRVFQLRDEGPLYGVRQSDDATSLLPSQPSLVEPVVVPGIPSQLGWWVTGRDGATGRPAVAVSRDLGASWTVRTLEVAATKTAIYPPTLVTGDGRLVYAFLNTGSEIIEVRSEDGGASWSQQHTTMPWPAGLTEPGALFGRQFGATFRGDRSLLIWLEDASGIVFLDSADAHTFRAATGPAGRVAVVPDGYVALAAEPTSSRDARTWSRIPRPPLSPPE